MGIFNEWENLRFVFAIGLTVLTYFICLAVIAGIFYIIRKIQKLSIEKSLLSRELVAYDEGVFFDYPEGEGTEEAESEEESAPDEEEAVKEDAPEDDDYQEDE